MRTLIPYSIQSNLNTRCLRHSAGILLFVIALFYGLSAKANTLLDERLYQQALNDAKEQQYERALQTLASIWPNHPLPNRYFYDFIAISSWAKRDVDILTHQDKIDIKTAPGYVIHALARAKRNQGQAANAQRLYQGLIRRYPENIEYQIALALCFIDQSKFTFAHNLLAPLEQQKDKNIDLLHALAYWHEAKNQLADALGYHQRVLDIDENNQTSKMARIMLLKGMGAASVASDYVLPDFLSQDQRHDIHSDMAAYRIRWGALYTKNVHQRFDNTDQGIQQMRALIAKHDQLNISLPEKSRNYFDLMVAHRDRKQMQEVLSIAKQLEEADITLPNHAKNALCDAYLYLQKADKAEPCYRDIIIIDDKHIEQIIGLYYALLEQEKVAQANDLLTKVSNVLSINLSDDAENIINDNKTRIMLTQALSYAFSDRHDLALKYMLKMHHNAPYNIDIRKELSSIYYWRGWLDKSLEEIEIGLHQDPKNSGLQINYARALLDNHEFEKSERVVNYLHNTYTENKHVQRLHKHYQRYDSPYVDLDIVHGSSEDGESIVSIDTDFKLVSQPIDYRKRLFFHHKRFDVKQDDDLRDDHRNGVGLQYKKPRQNWSAQLYQPSYTSDIGLDLSAYYRADDFKRYSAQFQSFADDTPKKALANDITAKLLRASYGYQWHESRGMHFQLAALDFSDDNQRYQVTANFAQRFFLRHNLHIWTRLNLYASQNTGIDRPYFNPKSDNSVEPQIHLDWLSYRHYELLLRQHLRLSFGNYYQQDFGNNEIWSINYEHQWTGQRQFDTIYGITAAERYYDGDAEQSLNFYLRFIWRF